ncbi:hypothetical protein NE237_008350 [Protea cynaroides]|uniref:Uncharacterized protein n=1 Tax=Protea cynaroides TaxID=273540 RepID=A0A9Q0KVM0_9MAGN|nr:hypothetical protein NE237_008350 [Protea cynaroides]
MSRLLYNFFPTDILPPQQLTVNGERIPKQVVIQKVNTREGTMNFNFFPNDLLPPQLPADGDMTTQTVHQSTPAQEGTNKFKGAALRTQQVHSHSYKAIHVSSTRQTSAFSTSKDVPPTF